MIVVAAIGAVVVGIGVGVVYGIVVGVCCQRRCVYDVWCRGLCYW